MIKKKPKRPLDRAVHQALALRLTIVGLVISVLSGLTVFFVERNNVGEEIIFDAREQGRLFADHITPFLDTPRPLQSAILEEEAQAFIASRGKRRVGHLVWAQLYDRASLPLAKFTDSVYLHIDAVQAYMNAVSRQRTPVDVASHRTVRIADALHIQLAMPLLNSVPEQVGFVDAIFAISPQAIAHVQRRVMRTMAAVVTVVLITTAVLYPIILSLTRKLTQLSGHLLDANLDTLQVLGSAIAKRDSDTNAHNFRVTIMAVRLAEAVGLSASAVRGLIKGAFLHDVGKIGISDNILLKAGRLTDEEFQAMKRHVDYGLEIVRRSEWLRDATDVVGYHHEKFDGRGYLQGLKGREIPVTARIFAIVDVFDALTSRRPYKEPLSFAQSMEILQQGRGSHFDPELLDAFAGISKSLYEQLAGPEGKEPQLHLEKITQTYFSCSVGQLV